MKKLLDESSPVPLYHQLSQILREKIESGEWKEGDKIPTELDLCREYGLSRGTVAQALRELELEGLIYRKQGRGTFVAEKKISQDLSHFYSFAKDLQERGVVLSSKVLRMEVVQAPSSVKGKLSLSGDRVFLIERLRFADDLPVILERIYLPLSFEEISHEVTALERGAIYDLFSKMGVKVSRAREEFEVVRMNQQEAALFGVEEGFPALLVRRITFDENEIPFEYRRSIIRADQCRYSVELKA